MRVRALGLAGLLSCLLLVSQALYAQVAPDQQAVIEIDRGSPQVAQVDGRSYTLTGSATLTLTDPQTPFVTGEVHLNSEDASLIIQNLRPSEVQEHFIDHVFVNGQPAVNNVNARLVPYVHGTIIQPHSPDYQPLTTYNQPRFTGDGRTYSLHNYYRSEQLADDEDQIASFVLKHGYMATFAENEDGSGASQVFIADQHDLRIAQLPAPLRGKVSFIRVFPWRWTAKRGYGGNLEDSQLLNSFWRYQWNANGESTIDMEYVPMRHNANWPSYDQINSLQNVTHLLGFNEPMQPDQSNMAIAQVLNQWPRLQESGLRLGSPCTTDGTIDWVYDFIEQADARGYRVDFITVHYYKGGWSNERLIAWMREIHERTGRPLWVTEFNNGAQWVRGHNPTLEQNAAQLDGYCTIMDQCDFIERYAVFNMRENRRIINEGVLTPAGVLYSENNSAQAYISRR